MKKEFFDVSNREDLDRVISEILSKGKNKILYFDEELKEEGSSTIRAGKYSIALENNVVLGFEKATIINKRIDKRNSVAAYLKPKDAESAVFIVLLS